LKDQSVNNRKKNNELSLGEKNFRKITENQLEINSFEYNQENIDFNFMNFNVNLVKKNKIVNKTDYFSNSILQDEYKKK
jgi:hypothetical protein